MAKCNANDARGFTLLELILALALSVLVMVVIGSLVQMYTSNFTTRGEDIRRVALARSILNMIADDLRSTVIKQEFDASVLQQMLMGQGGAQGGGASAGGSGSGQTSPSSGPNPSPGPAPPNTNPSGEPKQPGQLTGPINATPSKPGPSGGSTQSVSSAGSSRASEAGGTGTQGSATDAAATSTTSLPLGVYGSASDLTVDVSRLPRPDEYIAQQASIMSGNLSDVPGDIKSVAYFVQLPTNIGVADAMDGVTSTPSGTGMLGGLVRRQIDRAVMTNAEEMGQSEQLGRTGELIAPEVVSLEFSYYDGIEWLTQWDSSAQGLPWLVEISLAMQSKSGEKNGIVSPGVSLTTMPYDEQKLYGIEIYRLTVAIPGAQLQATTPQSANAAAGMESVGL